MRGADESYVQNLWRDPVCGDGICATPFEFASYGRFGCRADCGKLPEVQQLTTLQIDLYYDFRHPTKSIASAELMQQASWNLCPADGAPHGMDCYFDEAQRFASIKGETHVVLDDVPDGKWEIRIKRDFFDKIRGAVRVVDRLKEQAAWNRKYGAYLAARSDQDFEIDILEADPTSQCPLPTVVRSIAGGDSGGQDTRLKLYDTTVGEDP